MQNFKSHHTSSKNEDPVHQTNNSVAKISADKNDNLVEMLLKGPPKLKPNLSNSVLANKKKNQKYIKTNFMSHQMQSTSKHPEKRKDEKLNSSKKKIKVDTSPEKSEVSEEDLPPKKMSKFKSMFPKTFICKFCCRRYHSVEQLRQHTNSEHSDKPAHVCHVCNHQAASFSALMTHFLKHSENKRENVEKIYTKSKAEFSNLQLNTLNQSKPTFQCDRCKLTFSSKPKYNAHNCTEVPKKSEYTCAYCRHVSLTVEDYRNHIQSHSETPFTCFHCKFKAMSKKQLDAHRESCKMRTKSNAEFKCVKCNEFSSKSKKELNLHLKDCKENLKYSCTKCHSKFQEKESCEEHERVCSKVNRKQKSPAKKSPKFKKKTKESVADKNKLLCCVCDHVCPSKSEHEEHERQCLAEMAEESNASACRKCSSCGHLIEPGKMNEHNSICSCQNSNFDKKSLSPDSTRRSARLVHRKNSFIEDDDTYFTRRKSLIMDDENLIKPKSRKSSLMDDESDIKPKPKKSLLMGDENDMKFKPKNSSLMDDENDVKLKPKKSSLVDDENDVKLKPKKSSLVDGENDVKLKPKKSSLVDDENVIKPKPKKNSLMDDENEIKPTPKKNSLTDDENVLKPKPKKSSFTDDENIIKPKPLKIKIPKKPKLFTKPKCRKGRQSKNANNSFLCNYCDFTFCSKSTLLRHKRMHSGNPWYICQYCGKFFFRKDVYIRHEMNVHKKTSNSMFCCYYCKLCFNESQTLKEHVVAVHKESAFLPIKHSTNDSKSDESPSKPDIVIKQEPGIKKSEVSTKKIKLDTSPKNKTPSSETGFSAFKCSECFELFGSTLDIEAHMKTHQKKSLKKNKKTNNSVSQSRQRHFEEAASLPANESVDATVNFHDSSVSDISLEKDKEATHGEFGENANKDVGDEFSNADELALHSDALSSDLSQDLQCILCSQFFSNKNLLDDHSKTEHKIVEWYQCLSCAACGPRQEMIQHMLTHMYKVGSFVVSSNKDYDNILSATQIDAQNKKRKSYLHNNSKEQKDCALDSVNLVSDDDLPPLKEYGICSCYERSSEQTEESNEKLCPKEDTLQETVLGNSIEDPDCAPGVPAELSSQAEDNEGMKSLHSELINASVESAGVIPKSEDVSDGSDHYTCDENESSHAIEMPSSNAKEMPSSNAKEMPSLNANEMPSSNANEMQSSNVFEMPSSDVIETPSSDDIEMPSSDVMEVPSTDIEMPSLNVVEMSSSNVIGMPPSNVTEITEEKVQKVEEISSSEMYSPVKESSVPEVKSDESSVDYNQTKNFSQLRYLLQNPNSRQASEDKIQIYPFSQSSNFIIDKHNINAKSISQENFSLGAINLVCRNDINASSSSLEAINPVTKSEISVMPKNTLSSYENIEKSRIIQENHLSSNTCLKFDVNQSRSVFSENLTIPTLNQKAQNCAEMDKNETFFKACSSQSPILDFSDLIKHSFENSSPSDDNIFSFPNPSKQTDLPVSVGMREEVRTPDCSDMVNFDSSSYNTSAVCEHCNVLLVDINEKLSHKCTSAPSADADLLYQYKPKNPFLSVSNMERQNKALGMDNTVELKPNILSPGKLPGMFMCSFCGKAFASEIELLKHQKVEHSSNLQGSSHANVCNKCHQTFNDIGELMKHSLTCLKTYFLKTAVTSNCVSGSETLQSLLKKDEPKASFSTFSNSSVPFTAISPDLVHQTSENFLKHPFNS